MGEVNKMKALKTVGTGNKKVYFELLRIVACALVIFNHLEGYRLYGIASGSKQFFYMCLTMITRMNVPIFFMISGALLFDRDEELSSVLKKRVIKVVLLLVLFDFVKISVDNISAIIHGEDYTYTLYDFIRCILNNEIDAPYWYLYSYLGVLVTLPFFQRIAKKITKNEFLTLLVLHFISSSVFPIVNIFLTQIARPTLSLATDFQVPFAFEKPLFYTLVGYYIDKKLDVYKLKSKHICGLSFLCFTGIILSNLCTYIEAYINGVYSQNYVQLFDYVTSIVFFVFVKYIFVVVKPSLCEDNIGKNICFLGSMTLGIYMLDPILKTVFYDKYITVAEPLLPTLLVSLGWIIISMLLGTIITMVIKKIPGFKKIV